jgi:hypothetical protein
LATNFPEDTNSFIRKPKTTQRRILPVKDAGQWDIKSTNCGQALIVQVRTDS